MAEKRFTAGIGAANMDLHGRSRAALILHDSNPGFLHTSPGGVTRNILENLSRMGEKTALFSAIGNDLYGREILASGEAVGMDMSHMLRCPDCGSSSYMALIDPEGDMFIGMSDMRILEHITPDWLEGQKDALRKADAIVCDPCLTPEALEWITSDALAGVPIFSDPVSTTYARRLAPFAGKLHCLKPNVLELAAMTGCEISGDADMERAADVLLRARHALHRCQHGTARLLLGRPQRRQILCRAPSRKPDGGRHRRGRCLYGRTFICLPAPLSPRTGGTLGSRGGHHRRHQRRYRQSGDERGARQ